MLLFLVDGTAWAIPSPDVMVSLFASAAQVLALASVVFGKWFFSRRASRTKSQSSLRLPFYVSAALCAVCCAGWFLYATSVRDERMRQLQVNLNRDSKENGRTINDVSLKELPFSQQLKREDGITTQALSDIVSDEVKMPILDIRESEEFERGRVAHTRAVRFPDLMATPSDYLEKEKPALLLCFNGNRSSELCTYLQGLGYDVRFVIGGFEKWVAEDRPLEGAEGRSEDELRQVPDYPNKNQLLDTPEVMAMLEKRPDILVVDVRYPKEFEELGHLPGAVNMTLRKMTTPDMEKAFSELPKRPIIAPCYDKRSSFFALILGLRLSRLGYEFLGRYTTPESFSLPGQDKPHVAAWKAAHAERSLVSIAAEPLKGSLNALQTMLGSLALAIAALVVAMRGVLLPWTLKADRDRIVQQQIDPLLAGLKAEHAADPGARSRATMKLLREHKIRPLVSLIGTLILLVLFTLFFSVVDQASRASTESFLWIKSIGEADPMRILPLAVGALVAVMIATTGKEITRTRTIVSALAGAALCAIAWKLRAGVNLYLVLNLTLLILQSLLTKRWLAKTASERRSARAIRRYGKAPVVPLSRAHMAVACGNKAARLGQLMEAKLPVPNGFVISSESIDAWLKTRYWPTATRRAIAKAHGRLSSGPVAVRSSGINEDGADKSYAGVFDSILKVKPDGLFEAIENVARSLSSLRAQAYSQRGDESGCIIVQRMVNAEYAGVLFTEHPDESGSALVELVAGLGDELVSGRAEPLSLRLGRYTGRVLDDAGDSAAVRKASPIDLRPLFELGRRVEALFGKPQDIEWAYTDSEFYLLQARDITRLSRQSDDAHALRERERRRLLEIARASAASERDLRKLDQDELFVENELSELLPDATPFSLAWMNRLWDQGGTTHRACVELGIPYDLAPDSPPYVVSVFGSVRVNQWEGRRRLAKGPGTLASFRLTRAAEEIERSYREDFLPAFLKEARLREALDLDRLTQSELIDLFKESSRKFVEEDYLRAEIINIAADFYFKTAVRELEKRGLDPAEHLSHLPQTVVNEAMELLSAIGRGEAETSAFLKLFGHRAPQDYELGQPRYAENPELVATMAKRSAGSMRHVQEAPPVPEQRVLVLAIERARRYQSLKEEAKHHALRDLAFVRRLLLEIGERLDVGEGIFCLTPDEVARLDEPAFRRSEAAELIRARQEEAEALAEVHLPSVLTLSQLETLDVEGGTVVLVPSAGSLAGIRVSGRGEITGRARVLRDSAEIDSFKQGEILVARFTDPTWMPVFPLAGGIITEVGGWLSHAAIQAREYDINAIVGARGALDAISTGDLVCLHADGSIERVSERRKETRVRVHAPVTVSRERESLQAHLGDVSVRGALLLVTGHTLEIGEDLELTAAPTATSLRATIIRNGIPGVYGLMFREHADRAKTEGFRRVIGGVPANAEE